MPHINGAAGALSPAGIFENSLAVFVYHDISASPSEFCRSFNLSVHPRLFETQVELLKRTFNVIGPDDLVNGVLPRRAAMITFDDGFKSYFTTAVPVLARHGIPSIAFLNMSAVAGNPFLPAQTTYVCSRYPEFREYISKNAASGIREELLYMSCSGRLVRAYIEDRKLSVRDEVSRYSGQFASEADLRAESGNRLVFFGNHLYDHEVPVLLSDDELIASFKANRDELKKYANHRMMVSFPFGQPGLCFSPHQVETLLLNGAGRVFTSSGCLNRDTRTLCLDRIALDSTHSSTNRILGEIVIRSYGKRVLQAARSLP